MKIILLIITWTIFTFTTNAQSADGFAVDNFFKALGSPVNPKVQVSWNRYHTNEGLHEIYQDMIREYPDLVRLESIGKSFEGRDLWLLTVTNHTSTTHQQKPAFWIDGSIHANEIQATEVSLYTAWYLVENYQKNRFITDLLDEKVFYILPVMNPDGRHNFMRKPNTAHSSRGGMITVDDDGDGEYGEDGFDDLNGDGHITMMRRRAPHGQWREDQDDPRRMTRVKQGEFGEWELLGYEGIDRDGDGMVNEDRKDGYYDPNRDWGWNWQPDYVQRGAYHYPFSLPETRAVRDFIMDHPNIAGAQTYHNTGGMILRGPGTAKDEQYYLREDINVYDALGDLGEKLIPGYNYLTLHKDLYTVYGGQIDWLHLMRGIFTFTNELFTSYMYFNETPQRGWFGSGSADVFLFDKHLLFSDAFVPWEDFDHPQYGSIQIGGFKKNFGRINPGFMLEQDAHRNMAFTLYHAHHTPKLEIVEFTAKDLGSGLQEVIAVVANTRLIPTHAGVDLKFQIERPNYISLQGARVLAGMTVINRDLNLVQEQINNPSVIQIDNIPGMSSVTIKWIVEGGNNISVKVDSPKGGIITESL